MHEHIAILKVLADPTRLKILKLILSEVYCVRELRDLLDISQPAVSQHLTKLRKAGLATERKVGLWTYYEGNHARLQSALAALSAFMESDPAHSPAFAEVEKRRALLRRCAPGNKECETESG